MRLLIVGGSSDHLGGVEAFCARSQQALERYGNFRISRIRTETAYLTVRRLPAVLRGLSRLVMHRREKGECVWLQYVNLPDLLYLVTARLLGYQVMVTPHLGSNWRSQSNPFLRKLSGWMLKACARLALISPTQEFEINLPPGIPRSQIRNFLPENILDSLPDQKRAAGGKLRLVHSGRLSVGKGTFLFVDVCRILRAKGTPFDARITGSADDETSSQLRSMIQENNLSEDITVMGRIGDDELVEVLHSSDVLVHLSRIDSYPLIVLESLACSVFPNCMELAGARDMVERYDGHIVPEEAAASETAEFLSNQQLDALRERARKGAELVRRDYKWSNCAQALEQAVFAMVGNKSTGSELATRGRH